MLFLSSRGRVIHGCIRIVLDYVITVTKVESFTCKDLEPLLQRFGFLSESQISLANKEAPVSQIDSEECLLVAGQA